jgi:hypothetical protein
MKRTLTLSVSGDLSQAFWEFAVCEHLSSSIFCIQLALT